MHGPGTRGQGGSSMLASVRAGFAAALVAFVSFTASAADKPFQRSDLADSAVRLETQINLAQVVQAANEQAGADQQQQRERNLKND